MEVHYGNRKRIFLFRVADALNRGFKCAAGQIAPSGRSSFTRLTKAKNAAVLLEPNESSLIAVAEVVMANETELAYLVISIILILIISRVLTWTGSRRR